MVESSSSTNVIEENPRLTNLLIVGESESSISLSMNIQSLANFTRIIHIGKTDDAVTVLLQEEFSVVVLDNDSSNVDAASFSRIVKLNHSLARIIVISKDYSVKLIKNLINQGSVDFFLPVPIDDFTAYSVILEQQAKYEISKMLNQYVLKPPKFTPAYYLLHDPSLSFQETFKELQCTGCVVSYASVTRYTYFAKDFINLDEYLLSAYISAISLLGDQLFKSKEMLETINFGGNSIFFHFEKDLQFAIFFKNLTETNYKDAEAIVSVLVKNMLSHCSELLSSDNPIDEDENEYVTNIIELNLNIKAHLPLFKTTSKGKNKLVFFGNYSSKFSETIKPFSREFDISRQNNQDDTIIYISNHDSDILVIHPLLAPDISNISLATRAKDKSPRLQVIGLLKDMNSNDLVNILNSGTIDYVIGTNDKNVEFYSIIKKAAKTAKSIKSHSNPQKLMYSYDQSVVAKSLIKRQKNTFEKINTPELYGLFIASGMTPFYYKFWKEDDDEFELDPHLFSGFISSLVSFSDETFKNDSEVFSGLKLGDSNLITKHFFDFTFVFFIRNIDSSNAALVEKHIENTKKIMQGLLLMIDISEEQEDYSEYFEQIGVELFLKLASISPT